jgi:DNA-binding NarL/FixJ family response regulator
MSEPIRLLICDDHRLLTDALVSLVATDPGLELVADPVDNGYDAVELCRTHHPDVAMMDIEMPGDIDGLEATRRIRQVSPKTRVVVVSGHQRPTVMVEAIEAGAAGFLDKNTAFDDLMSTVRAAAAGEVLVDPAVLAELLPRLAAERRAADDAEKRLGLLTPREREVLGLMAEGCRSDAIAARLFISPPTVRTHAQNILSKLGVHSQLEAVALAAKAS